MQQVKLYCILFQFHCRVFGIRLGTIIFASLVVVGQIVFALGGLFDTFWLMVVGRFVFG
jgi:hypothetical protein